MMDLNFGSRTYQRRFRLCPVTLKVLSETYTMVTLLQISECCNFEPNFIEFQPKFVRADAHAWRNRFLQRTAANENEAVRGTEGKCMENEWRAKRQQRPELYLSGDPPSATSVAAATEIFSLRILCVGVKHTKSK